MSRTFAVALISLSLISSAAADVVTDWNGIALETIRADRVPPPKAARVLAMVHVAMYDAVNSIDRTHRPYSFTLSAPQGTSREAAAAQAGYRVLVALFPAHGPSFSRARREQLSNVLDEPKREAGIALGDAAASQILTRRAADGADREVEYQPSTQVGKWRPTPPGFRPALLPAWRYVSPFAIGRASQFRTARPPEIASADYARDFDEVKLLGRANSKSRTVEQTEIAYFWADGPNTVTPPGHWNEIARAAAAAQGNTLSQNARLFALLNIAMADAAIACWDMKYEHNCWRPVTAIREAGQDGNPDTAADPDWAPLLDTPPFPTCTSGHSTFSGAAAKMLALFFGSDAYSFTAFSDGYPGSRSFMSFSQAAREAGRSRIYGGIHFEFDNRIGLEMGESISKFVFDRTLSPLSPNSPDNVHLVARPVDEDGWRAAVGARTSQ